jgi:hydroxymethylpyrimidine pyrophosphatase-like HAD family hydrolase
VYSGRQWLEIMPAAASKANAILMLKEKLGCDRVVCFGDGKNDISMFSICDEKYAVANAVDELKAMATAVIGSNNQDGVARWLAENAEY